MRRCLAKDQLHVSLWSLIWRRGLATFLLATLSRANVNSSSKILANVFTENAIKTPRVLNISILYVLTYKLKEYRREGRENKINTNNTVFISVIYCQASLS